jgi:flagellar biosynthesis/type III secretory pathway protein FliH
MLDGFIPLERLLRPVETEAATTTTEPVPLKPISSDDIDKTIGAARRFRAALSDAIEVAVRRLLPRIALDVLGRELQLGGSDIGNIVANALDRFSDERPLVCRAHPDELAALAELELPALADDSLCRGDVVLVLHSGTIDLRLEARLAAILAHPVDD